MNDRLLGLLPGGLWLAVVLAGCGSELTEPVARLTLSPAEIDLGYPGSTSLSAEWQMTAPLAGEAASVGGDGPRVFVHLLDRSGEVVRTFDHELPFPWRPGEVRSSAVDVWQSALAPPVPPGDYDLTLGLYDLREGRRWALETDAPEVGRGEYRVARVRALAPSSGVEVAFGGSWEPTAEGSDRQVLARRWLVQAGTIELSGLPEAARVELGLRLPEAAEGERLVIREGLDGAWVRVSSPCAGGEVLVEGPGYGTVELELRDGEDGGCTLRIEPSFVVLDLDSLARRSVALERLTWSLGGA